MGVAPKHPKLDHFSIKAYALGDPRELRTPHVRILTNLYSSKKWEYFASSQGISAANLPVFWDWEMGMRKTKKTDQPHLFLDRVHPTFWGHYPGLTPPSPSRPHHPTCRWDAMLCSAAFSCLFTSSSNLESCFLFVKFWSWDFFHDHLWLLCFEITALRFAELLVRIAICKWPEKSKAGYREVASASVGTASSNLHVAARLCPTYINIPRTGHLNAFIFITHYITSNPSEFHWNVNP